MASKELKEERRAQGLCVYCGRPAVIKADGTPARRCKECSGSHVRQKRDARHGIETRGRVTGRPRDTLSKSITRDCGKSWLSALIAGFALTQTTGIVLGVVLHFQNLSKEMKIYDLLRK